MQTFCLKGYRTLLTVRACLHGGVGPQVGEVTHLGGVTHLSCLILIWWHLHDRWSDPPQVISPTWGHPPWCKQALIETIHPAMVMEWKGNDGKDFWGSYWSQQLTDSPPVKIPEVFVKWTQPSILFVSEGQISLGTFSFLLWTKESMDGGTELKIYTDCMWVLWKLFCATVFNCCCPWFGIKRLMTHICLSLKCHFVI